MSVKLPADAPSPRSCQVIKLYPEQAYGFKLYAERGKGQLLIGKVDAGSPADISGLRSGDRIYAVNGASIVDESHKQAVTRMKEDPSKCCLLVIDESGDVWYRERKIAITANLENIVHLPHVPPTKRRKGKDRAKLVYNLLQEEGECIGAPTPPVPTPPVTAPTFSCSKRARVEISKGGSVGKGEGGKRERSSREEGGEGEKRERSSRGEGEKRERSSKGEGGKEERSSGEKGGGGSGGKGEGGSGGKVEGGKAEGISVGEGGNGGGRQIKPIHPQTFYSQRNTMKIDLHGDMKYLMGEEFEKNAYLANPPHLFLKSELDKGLFQSYVSKIENFKGSKLGDLKKGKIRDSFSLLLQNGGIESLDMLVSSKALFKPSIFTNRDSYELNQLIQCIHSNLLRNMRSRRQRGRDIQPVESFKEGDVEVEGGDPWGWDEIDKDEGVEGGRVEGAGIDDDNWEDVEDVQDVIRVVMTVGLANASITLAPSLFPLLVSRLDNFNANIRPVNVSKTRAVSKYLINDSSALSLFFSSQGVKGEILRTKKKGVWYEGTINPRTPAFIVYSVKKMTLSMKIPYSRRN